MVRSMGPISEVDMTYSMDCYFRQSWVDRRLAFESEKETLALSISMLQRIWKPDTYFYNGKQSYLHTITTPNKFVRLFRDGRVLYSSRLTIKAGCPMNLEDFPMDTQRCPLKFGSCEYSMLFVSFHLQRHMGNFLIQVYGPCVLLVVLSWVSFWLNREATADRVSLGITTVLTMTFLGLEARTDLPKVPYPTALDFFVFLSFAFIFATIIQFAVVHYFTKYGSGECYFSADFSSESSSDEEGWQEGSCGVSFPGPASGESGGGGASRRGDPRPVEVIPLSEYRVPRCVAPRRVTAPRTPWPAACFGCARPPRGALGAIRPPPPPPPPPAPSASPEPGGAGGGGGGADAPAGPAHRLSLRSSRLSRSRRKRKTPRFNSVSKIDRASRVVFPLCFLAINMFYWYSYLSRSKRIMRSDGAI